MSKLLYGIFGAGGHGRETMPLARQQMKALGVPESQLVFVDDGLDIEVKIVNGHAVLTYAEFLNYSANKRFISIAISNSQVREKLAMQCAADGVKLWNIIASNVVVMDSVQLGEGALLSPFVTLTSNIKIGKCFHANMYSYVTHDCMIGDFVTFAPNVHCNGNVVVEDHAYIGTGAVLRQGKSGAPLVIGRGAVVGMGAVVTKSVAPGTTVVGNPARVIESRAK